MAVLALNTKRLTWLAAGLFLLLFTAHCAGLVLSYGLGYHHVFGLVALFNMATEYNVPTLFASVLLLVNSLLFLVLFLTDTSDQRARRAWLLLAVAFSFLAVDEAVLLHERLIEPVRAWLGVGGYLYFAWVIPYAIGVAVLGLFVTAPIWRLGWRFRCLFSLAAVAYLGGAVGIEMLGGYYYEANQRRVDLTYRLYQTLEETLEFCGLLILLFTLLELLKARYSTITLRLS